MDAFQCYLDPTGDILTHGGWVLQPTQGVAIQVGGGGHAPGAYAASEVPDLPRALSQTGFARVGGSGRNMMLSGTPPVLASGDTVPRVFIPARPGEFLAGDFFITAAGGTAEIFSEGVVVAARSSGSAIPGTYSATTAGRTRYNAGSAFSLSLVAESSSPDPGTSVRLFVTAGSALSSAVSSAGEIIMFSDDNVEWQAVDDGDWTLVVAADGSAEIRFETDVVAIREEGLNYAGEGRYEATALGSSVYNLTDAEPVDGEPFTIIAQAIPRSPNEGWVFVLVTKTAGVVVAAQAPAFAATLPAPSGDDFAVPVAYCDGDVVTQIHSGAIIL